MENVFKKFIKRRCELIIEEENATEVLRTINGLTSESVKIGDCGWAEQPSKWYVVFYTTEDVWIEVKMVLRKKNLKEIKEPLKDCFGRDVFLNI